MGFSSLLVDERDSFVHPVYWRKYTHYFTEGRFVRPAGTSELDIGLAVLERAPLRVSTYIQPGVFNLDPMSFFLLGRT